MKKITETAKSRQHSHERETITLVELRFTMCKQKTVVSHEGPLSLENTRNGAQVPHGEIYGLFCSAQHHFPI